MGEGSGSPRLDRLALEALRLVLDGYAVPKIESCYYLDQRGAYREAWVRFRISRDQLDELPRVYRFGIMTHIFRRRSRDDRVPKNKGAEVASIQELVELAHQEVPSWAPKIWTSPTAEDDFEKIKEMPQIPVSFNILNGTKESHYLFTDLQIIIYTSELQTGETDSTRLAKLKF